IEVDIGISNMDRTSAAILIVIEHNECTLRVSQANNLANRRTKAVHEADSCYGNDQGLTVNCALIVFNADTIASCRNKMDLCSTFLLSEPDVTHGGKFKITENNLFALSEAQGTRYGVDAGRHIRHDSDLGGGCTDESGKAGAGGLVLSNPDIPGRAVLVPTGDVVAQPIFHCIGQRTLRTAVEINLAGQKGEARTDCQHFRVTEHQ